jgi:N-carbamoyl-L-amino-acid hydrolase
VFFSVDFRHPDDAAVAAMEDHLRAAVADIAAAAGVAAAVERVWDSPAVRFNPDCIDAVERAAAEQGYPARRIVSGPGHDAAYVARVAPTAMIFVPCEGGLSHNELEKIEPEHATAGANVLLRAVLDTDQRFAERARGG